MNKALAGPLSLFMLCLSALSLPISSLADDICLDGFDLTAIVVIETDIKQSVEAYNCRMVFPEDASTYDLYNQLRGKWKPQRQKQKQRRDKVYQRIYGDAWQAKVEEWTQVTAVTEGKLFKATDISCQDLRKEMGAYSYDWQALYQDSAREAASARYDGLRCKSTSVITIK